MNLMRRLTRGMVLGGGIIFAATLPAEIDPRKDEGGDAKKARPVLDKGEGEGHEEYHRRLATEGEETLKEINRLLDEIQKNLAGKQTDSGTQAKQKAAVERMEELIKSLSKGCSQCKSSGSSSSKQNQSQTSSNSEEKKSDRQKAEEERRRKAREEKEKMQAQQMKPESEKEKKDGKVENERVADRKPPEAKSGKLSDELRELARWGLLPPKLAEEMLLSTGKEAPPEYREIISRYYRRMTEQYLKTK
jgi:hypothetical protein